MGFFDNTFSPNPTKPRARPIRFDPAQNPPRQNPSIRFDPAQSPGNATQSRGFFGGVGDFFEGVGGGIGDFFEDVGGGVSSAFEDAFSFLTDTGGNFVDSLTNFVGELPADAGRFITGLPRGFTGAVESLGGGVFRAGDKFLRFTGNLTDTGSPILNPVINPLALITPGNPSFLPDLPANAVNEITNVVGPAAETVGGILEDNPGILLGGVGPLGPLNPTSPLDTGLLGDTVGNIPGLGGVGGLLGGFSDIFGDFGGGVGDIGAGQEGIEEALREAGAAVREGAEQIGPRERQALTDATAARRAGLAGAGEREQAGLGARIAGLRGTQADVNAGLQPAADLGQQALGELVNRPGTTLSEGATFAPGAAPETFGAPPESGLTFGPGTTRGEQFDRDPNETRQFTAPTEFAFTPEDLANDPGFQFRLQQGQQARERSAAARGGLVSGRTLAGVEDFAQGLASTEFDAAFRRNAGEFQNQFQREAQQFDMNADIFNANFQRDLQGFSTRETAFDRMFGREAATFDRNATEFGNTFARQVQSHDRAQQANDLASRREFDAFRTNEDNRLQRDSLRLQDSQQQIGRLTSAAGLGANSRNLLAQLNATLGTNLSEAEAAPALAEATRIIQDAQIENELLLGLGLSETNQIAAIANAEASEANAIGLARSEMATRQSQLLGTILGAALGFAFEAIPF